MFGDPINSKENRLASLEQRVKLLEESQYPVSLRCQAVKLDWLERVARAILGHLGLSFRTEKDVLVPDAVRATDLTH